MLSDSKQCRGEGSLHHHYKLQLRVPVKELLGDISRRREVNIIGRLIKLQAHTQVFYTGSKNFFNYCCPTKLYRAFKSEVTMGAIAPNRHPVRDIKLFAAF